MREVQEVKQEIGEQVRVLASFAEFKITIHFFTWRGRTYKVDSMNLFHIERDAERQIYQFAVSATEGGNGEHSRTAALGNTYQLTFNPATLEWQLKDVVSL